MSENCLHLIKLKNIHDNDIISHQILLINGSVDKPKCSKFKVQDIKLCVEKADIINVGLTQDTGKFKFVLDLGSENKQYELKFTYCNAKLTINLNYQRKESVNKIQPLLILAADEAQQCEKVSLNQEKIDLNLLLIQSVYAEKLKESAGERLTFVFNDKSKIFVSKLVQEEIFNLSEQQLWMQFAKELLESHWGKREELKFIAFINCSKYLGEELLKSQEYSYENIRKYIKGHAALGAGGLALFSTTYFYSWPNHFRDILNCFLNHQVINLAIEADDSNYRKTRGGVYATSLGAVCHEIGHIFDLGHDIYGVMGSNFDYINRVFTLQTRTEHLLERIVEPNTEKQLEKSIRFTLLKKPANGFLQRYREQQENDSFYFSANSAMILRHHAWLRNDLQYFQSITFEVQLDNTLGCIKSLNAPLKIIEVREITNSLVKEWFDLQKTSQDPMAFQFHLKGIKNYHNKNYYLFVMSVYGHTKKIEF